MGTPRKRKMHREERATLREYSDRELMEIIAECEDDDGYVDTRSIVDTVNIVHDRPNTCVACRLSWMRRFGYIDKHPKQKGVWKINARGRALVSVPLMARAAVPRSEGAWASTVGGLAANAPSSPEARKFAQREWKHYMERKAQ